MKACDLFELLARTGFNFFTGVPCSYLAALCREIDGQRVYPHVPAVREDLALGLAAGAYLAGRLPVVYMQNSGLGYSIEAFASLQMMYRLPCLVIMSYRGPEDAGWQEHEVMGAHTEALLKTLGLSYTVFTGDVTETEMTGIRDGMIRDGTPHILLVTRGALA